MDEAELYYAIIFRHYAKDIDDYADDRRQMTAISRLADATCWLM